MGPVLPYDTLMDEGRRFRGAGRLNEALSRFHSACGEVPPQTKPWALARHQMGLVDQDRGRDADAIEPFAEAYRGMDNRPDDVAEAAEIGADYGLSLIRLYRWADAVPLLEKSIQRFEQLGRRGALAAGLHNLAMALTRGGDAARGLAAAERASSIRREVSGDDHPLTIDTQLVESYALIETGNLPRAKDSIAQAGRIVRANVGEGHGIYADVLMTEARRVARTGDGGAAEALARRSLHIHREVGSDAAVIRLREQDAVSLAALWRTGVPARGPDDVAVWRMKLQHTLRGYRVATMDFAPAHDLPKEWIFFVPASWPRTQALYAARVVFADANVVLNAREPADPNFLDATQAEAVDAGDVDVGALFKKCVWEPSAAYSLVRGTLSVPLSLADTTRALAAPGVLF